MNKIEALRIALITCDDVFDAGGVGTSIVRIARGLSTQFGMRVDIVMLRPDENTGFNPYGKNGITRLDQSIDNVTFYRLAPWTGGVSPAQRWVDMHYALLSLAEERQYDLMQAFYASITGFPVVYAAQELNIPSIVSIRGNDIIGDVFHTERFHHLKWALEKATQFTAVSQEGLNKARIISACPDKGKVILNCIRPEDYTGGVQELSLSRPMIGSLAVFKHKKGLEVLLCAFKMLLQHYPTAQLLLVGFVIPAEQSRFDSLVAKYDLGDKIIISGHVPRREVLRYLRNMDVFAFTSLHDGCPNALLEAMLAGLPIVATRSGALLEMIEDGKEGLLVRPGSAVELCEALVKMLSMEDDERAGYGKWARERVLARFAPRQELEAYKELYEACKEIWRT